MAELKQTDIDKMTTISAQIGQDIADSVTFVESQITVLSNELTNIAPIFSPVVIFSDQNISKPITLDPTPTTLVNGVLGIDAEGPDQPDGLNSTDLLAEADAIVAFEPSPQDSDFPTVPDFGVVVSPEALALPPLLADPSPLSGSPVLANSTLPTNPEIPILPALDFNQITIPPIPTLNFPTFGESLPAFDVVLPDFTFEFIEQPYQSGLLDATTARLLNDVTNGGTGLGPTIEQDIFDRSSERDARNIDLEVTRFKNQASTSGFELPFGVLLDGVNDIISKHDDKLADLSRDIAIEQAQLAQNNTQFAISQSINLEGTLITHANQVAERAFQAARSVAEFQIAFHNAELAGYNARLDRYARGAQVHFELLRSETVKLDLFRAELEGVNSLIQKDQLKIQEFNARVGRLTTEVQLFNARVSIMNNVNDLNRVRIAKFSADIEAFNAILLQNRNNIDLYNAQLRSTEIEFARVSAEVAIQNTKLEGVRIDSGNRAQELNALIDNQKNQLAANQNAINTFSAVSGRVSNRESNLNTFYGNDISKFNSESESQKSAIALEQDNVRIKLDHAVKDMDRIIEITRMAIQKNFKEWDFRTVVAQSVLAAKQFILEAGARSDDTTIENL